MCSLCILSKEKDVLVKISLKRGINVKFKDIFSSIVCCMVGIKYMSSSCDGMYRCIWRMGREGFAGYLYYLKIWDKFDGCCDFHDVSG